MNPANIDNPETSAGRVYRVLKERGDWVDGYKLTHYARVTAVSTWVSAIRLRLTLEPDRREAVEVRRTKHGWEYRIVRIERAGMMELFV